MISRRLKETVMHPRETKHEHNIFENVSAFACNQRFTQKFDRTGFVANVFVCYTYEILSI